MNEALQESSKLNEKLRESSELNQKMDDRSELNELEQGAAWLFRPARGFLAGDSFMSLLA